MAALTWVFLLDVDNTLLDNDAVKREMERSLESTVGHAAAQRFWDLYEAVRQDTDRVDFPETLRRFQSSGVSGDQADEAARLINDLPYERYRFPGVIEALHHLAQLGTTVILSDGDAVYQPAKIARAGLTDAVGGRVMIVTHKEVELPGVLVAFPADRYAMIEDKPRILGAIKRKQPERFLTILVHQGKYAHDPSQYDGPAPDLIFEHIGALVGLTAAMLQGSREAEG